MVLDNMGTIQFDQIMDEAKMILGGRDDSNRQI